MNEFGITTNERFYEDNTSNEEESGNDYYDEIEHEEDKEDDEEKELSDEDSEDTRVHLSFSCDDCDYRWDDIIVGNKEKIEREEFDIACPMCGSIAITQI